MLIKVCIPAGGTYPLKNALNRTVTQIEILGQSVRMVHCGNARPMPTRLPCGNGASTVDSSYAINMAWPIITSLVSLSNIDVIDGLTIYSRNTLGLYHHHKSSRTTTQWELVVILIRKLVGVFYSDSALLPIESHAQQQTG